MNSTLDDTQPGFLIALARVLGRSRLGQFVAAVLVASVSGGTAYLLWQYRDLAGFFLTYFIFLYVLTYGARKALEFLPIPVGMRQAWVRRKDLYTLMCIVCFLAVAYFLPGTSWPGWRYLAFSIVGAAFGSVTLFLVRCDARDRRKKSGNP